MSIVDAFFRPRTRSQQSAPVPTATRRASVRGGSRSRQRGLAAAEPLERRELLATDVTITRTTLNLRFSTDPTGQNLAYGEYQAFAVKNNGPLSYTDVWFRASDFVPGQKVQLGSKEDGLYEIGSLAPGETKTAFIYMVATDYTKPLAPDPQTYKTQVWDRLPSDPLAQPLSDNVEQTFAWVGEAIVDDAASNTFSCSVVYRLDGTTTSVPVIGGTMEMTVTGDVKNQPDRILFTPASSLNWPADAFELTTAQVTYSRPPQLDKDVIFEKPIQSTPPAKTFSVLYTFQIKGSTSAPTPLTPTQYTANGVQDLQSRKFQHARLLTGLADIPQPIQPDVILTVDKQSYRGGVLTDTYVQNAPLQYVTTIKNMSGITGTDIVIADQLPTKVSWTGVTYSAVVTTGTGSVEPPQYDPITGMFSCLTTLDPGAVLTVTINTVVLTTASQSITNTLSATVPNGATFSDDDTDWPDVALAVTKTSSSPAGTATYVPGAAFQYVVAFTNNGPADETGISISDLLPAKLTAVSIGSINWGGNAPGSYTLSDHTLTGAINLNRNTTVTFTINATVDPLATGTMTNTAVATLPVGTTASATDTDEPINLYLYKTDNTDVYYKGGTTTYQIIVRNDGATAVTGIDFRDILTTNTNLDLALTTWSAAYTNASGTLPTAPTKNDIIGKLALDPTGFVVVTINAKIKPNASGNLVNTATISAGVLLVSSTDTNRQGSIVPQPGDAAIIVGTDDGCSYPPSVFVMDVTGAILQTITWQQGLFEKTFRGGVRVTTGDVNRDGLADLVVGSGRGRVGEIRVFLAQQGHPGGVYYQYSAAYNTQPFGATYNAGVEVAVGDIDGDGDGDLIAARSSGTPTVSGFVVDANQLDPVANTPKFSFRAFPSPYANGAMIAAGDFTGDGIVEIVTGSNSGIRATVQVWNVVGAPVVTRTIYPIAPTFTGGVTVWVGRYADATHTDDGVPDIFVGAGLAGQSVTEVYNGVSGAQLLRTQAFATLSRTAAQLNLAGLDLVGNGVVTDVYGVRGLNGSGGATGVRRMQLPSTATLWLSQDPRLKPPLRIASVVSPALPPPNGFRSLGASRTVRR